MNLKCVCEMWVCVWESWVCVHVGVCVCVGVCGCVCVCVWVGVWVCVWVWCAHKCTCMCEQCPLGKGKGGPPNLTSLYNQTAFALDETSGGPCLPTEDGQPGLKMALTVTDSTIPGTAVTTTTQDSPTTGSGTAMVLVKLLQLHEFLCETVVITVYITWLH